MTSIKTVERMSRAQHVIRTTEGKLGTHRHVKPDIEPLPAPAAMPHGEGDRKPKASLPRARRDLSSANAAKVEQAKAKMDGAPAGYAKPGLNIAMQSTLKAKDATRQDISTQIQALKASIDKNLKQIASLVLRHENDKAAMICGLVAQKRGQIISLAERQAELLKNEPDVDKETPKPSKLRVAVKVKKYKRWSER